MKAMVLSITTSFNNRTFNLMLLYGHSDTEYHVINPISRKCAVFSFYYNEK